jgi:hypothetical protein
MGKGKNRKALKRAISRKATYIAQTGQEATRSVGLCAWSV